MVRRRIALVVVAFVLVLSSVACSKSTRDRLIGSWQEDGESHNVITFEADGSLRQESYGTTYTATWTVLDETNVEVRFAGDSARLGTTKLEVRFKDEWLRTTNSAGRLQQWKRK